MDENRESGNNIYEISKKTLAILELIGYNTR